MIRSGWDAEDPSYRRYFTGRLIPDAWPELAREYDELQRLSLPPANVEAYWEFAARLDVRAEAARLRVPALVLHCRGDRMVPLHAGRALAAAIPGARWIELEGANLPVFLLAGRQPVAELGTRRQARDYGRHWTPVHLDFIVPDLDAMVARLAQRGGTLDRAVERPDYGRIAYMADPFGNGFDLIEFSGPGYDAVKRP